MLLKLAQFFHRQVIKVIIKKTSETLKTCLLNYLMTMSDVVQHEISVFVFLGEDTF